MTKDSSGRKTPPDATREERLAAALRANLTRRKAQARARSAEDNNKTAETGPEE
ncbi:hypothetical protein [Rhodobacter capsulatus]|jgi:hypothetical protein|uniref:Uncharacterized protein n=1 Tax=Rhodobacter capsulatus (strain ATCC BAA-309 / NBRC 16581 / SB1003) TaxID=272942 RepID=D5AML6_RHOCB|nr:hypothetical protein [Rhodobacter capsulatus]ADE86292.1 conserved hypothetical protein [Rhodobacter capsulatus SB 1003]ETD00903.1 hypothetical protein U714_14185 [Rhodobacter capsulatus DE442]ETD75200.1 hypothetical protein U717_14345 [Rhodobacter capsulatus R121]ETD81024.1 hypothetical protein U716_11820 [Rhodobacter capsulatus B6]ETD85256.1 hypothetical protein U703_03540 [Rhodobacter capsulatus YW1]